MLRAVSKEDSNSNPPDGKSGGVTTEGRFWATEPSPQPRTPLTREVGFAAARPARKVKNRSERKTVLTVDLHNDTVAAGIGDGQLRSAFGTIGEIHDLLAELVVTGLVAQRTERFAHILLFHLGARRRFRRCQAGGGKPQRLRIERQQARRLLRRVAKLKTHLDSSLSQMRGRPRQ